MSAICPEIKVSRIAMTETAIEIIQTSMFVKKFKLNSRKGFSKRTALIEGYLSPKV